MVRHPHFTQPVFVRFPRPASLSGREGIERFPPAADLPFADAVVRRLRRLDGGIAGDAVRSAIDGRPEDEVRRALSATTQRRPDDVLAFFRGCLRRAVASEAVAPPRGVAPAGARRRRPLRAVLIRCASPTSPTCTSGRASITG